MRTAGRRGRTCQLRLIGRSVDPGTSAGKDFRAIRQQNAASVGHIAAVFCSVAFHRDMVTRFHRRLAPTLPDEHIGAAHFKAPARSLTASVFGVNVQPRMRICPLQLRHDT